LYTLIILVPISAAQAADAGVPLPQADGSVLTLPAPAQRIVTLAPNLAELVFAAGAGNKLQAVVEYSNFPAEVQQLPRVGDAFRIDLERIIEIAPDLVIAWKSGNPQSALFKLEQLGVKVWQVEITRPEEIAATVKTIAIAAGTETEGLPVARRLQSRLAQLKHQNADKSAVGYFYQIAARPLYTINGQHIISRSLEVCGGRNVFSGLPALAPQVSRESILLANPQAMIAPQSEDDPSALAAWQEWPQLTAVQNNSMLYLPADKISQATPRLLDSIDLACKLLDQVRKSDKRMEQK
jgi:iron complex transport system substrate-binding protein